MTVVSNDPAWLPFVSSASISSYFAVVSSTMVLYDWVLTFRQEFELVWMQHWSFMTVLYVCVRYIGILYSVIMILWNIPHWLTDVNCLIVYFIWEWTPIVANAILGVIMMIRIHAMYGRSKKMLACLVLVLLASTIASVVMVAIANIGVSAEEFVPLGFHICLAMYARMNHHMNQMDLIFESMISTAIWEILTFILAFWVVLKHFRELRQSPTGPTIGDCFMVLTKSHAFYFVVFAVVAGFTLGSTTNIRLMFAQSVGSEVYICTLQVAQALQMFVLGPRLILSIRKYHAKLVARSDEGIGMTTIRFQAGGDVSTSGDV